MDISNVVRRIAQLVVRSDVAAFVALVVLAAGVFSVCWALGPFGPRIFLGGFLPATQWYSSDMDPVTRTFMGALVAAFVVLLAGVAFLLVAIGVEHVRKLALLLIRSKVRAEGRK